MMQKNEKDLLQPWIIYHANLFGIQNLYIYDNGSTDPETLSILKRYEKLGANIEYNFPTKQDFEKKGEIISSKILELEKSDKYDFFFPLDCDEFIACLDEDNKPSIDLTTIEKHLLNFKNDPHVLMIQRAYDNNPTYPDYYLPKDSQRKCFFASESCAALDVGFHDGKAKTTSTQIKTKIIYFHFHYRPYEQFQKFSTEKLNGRISDFSKESLLKHLKERKPGFHLIPGLLMTEEEYYKQFNKENRTYYPELNNKIQNLGTS